MQGKERRSYTMKDYNKVLKLREKGYTFEEVSEKADVGRTTCQKWVNTDRKPRSNYAERRTKKPKEDYEELDKNLAYIYGVLIGDGYIEESERTFRIGLNVTDKDFAENFLEKLAEWSGMKTSLKEREVKHDHKTKYGCRIKCTSHYTEVRLASKVLVEFLKQKSQFKTNTWKVPEEIIDADKETKSSFIRGIFDSEGFSIHSGSARRIELEMKGREGLKTVQRLLKDLKISSHIDQASK